MPSSLSEHDNRTFAMIATELRMDGVGGPDVGEAATIVGLWLAALVCMLLTIQVTVVSFMFFVAMIPFTVRLLQMAQHARSVTRVKALMDRMVQNASHPDDNPVV